MYWYFFLAGGIADIFMLPSLTWFTILDLVAAYIPLGYFAGKLVGTKKKRAIACPLCYRLL